MAKCPADRDVRANKSAPDVSLSNRCTSFGRLSSSNPKASSKPSTWFSVLVPPCVARPAGLLITSAASSLWITMLSANSISSSVRSRRLRTGRALEDADASAGGTRSVCPANSRSPGVARFPSTRNCPVRAQRDTMLNDASGKCRLNQRSRRMPSSSGATTNCRMPFSSCLLMSKLSLPASFRRRPHPMPILPKPQHMPPPSCPARVAPSAPFQG